MTEEQEWTPFTDAVPLAVDGEVEHILGSTCWCQPVIDYEDILTGARVYVHRRTIDGPVYEKVELASV